MVICFFLFFAVNPLYFICVGFNAGKNSKKLWVSPIRRGAITKYLCRVAVQPKGCAAA